MITAQEAKQLVILSEQNINRILEKADKRIREEASAGKHEVFLWEDGLHVSVNTFNTPTMTPFQAAVCKKLNMLGFGTNYQRHGEPYVPRGSMDEYNKIQNWVIRVSWL